MFYLLPVHIYVSVLFISLQILYCAIRFWGCTFNNFEVIAGVPSNIFLVTQKVFKSEDQLAVTGKVKAKRRIIKGRGLWLSCTAIVVLE